MSAYGYYLFHQLYDPLQYNICNRMIIWSLTSNDLECGAVGINGEQDEHH